MNFLLRTLTRWLRRAFPDYAGTNVEQISEGEKVANRFVFLSTHLGEFEGVSPTGT